MAWCASNWFEAHGEKNKERNKKFQPWMKRSVNYYLIFKITHDFNTIFN